MVSLIAPRGDDRIDADELLDIVNGSGVKVAEAGYSDATDPDGVREAVDGSNVKVAEAAYADGAVAAEDADRLGGQPASHYETTIPTSTGYTEKSSGWVTEEQLPDADEGYTVDGARAGWDNDDRATLYVDLVDGRRIEAQRNQTINFEPGQVDRTWPSFIDADNCEVHLVELPDHNHSI